MVNGLLGFSGNALGLSSGVNSLGNSSAQSTINFVNPTPYVGFMWNAQFVSQNTQFVNLTLQDNSVVTLKNCRESWNPQCVGAYVSQNWMPMSSTCWRAGSWVTSSPTNRCT